MNNVLQRIKQVVDQQSDLPCIVSEGNSWSYGEMWENAARFAAYVTQQGIRKGDRIALVCDNSAYYVAAFYGTLLAGAVVVPMNTSSKIRDFNNWFEHCAARMAVVDFIPRELRKLLDTPAPTQLFAIDTDLKQPLTKQQQERICGTWSEVESCQPLANHATIAGSDLACIIYTSGTTGNPKGVMINHQNLSANISSILEVLPIRPGDAFLNVLPFYYSYGNSVLHSSICAGATLYLENSTMYPNRILEKLQTLEIAGFAGVPSTYALLMARGKVSEYNLSRLKFSLQAGGAMPTPLIQEVREQFGGELYVMYGQTEATARLTCLPPADLDQKLGSVGLPIPGVEIKIVHDDGRECMPGEIGEVLARGDNISPGYWHNPNATAATFRDGWLRTGDLGHKDQEGYLYLEGRRSDMIKSGANRISPLEIEEVISELPEIEEVAVAGHPDELLGQTVAAFVVIKPGHSLDHKALKRHCLENLASYKIPKSIHELQALPKTASGKVKKHLLIEELS